MSGSSRKAGTTTDVVLVNPGGSGRYTLDKVNRTSHTDQEMMPTTPIGSTRRRLDSPVT
jgi:hypothetical protein